MQLWFSSDVVLITDVLCSQSLSRDNRALRSSFLTLNVMDVKFEWCHLQRGSQIYVGYEKNCEFQQLTCSVLKMVQDGHIVSIKDQYEIHLLNGNTGSDLE